MNEQLSFQTVCHHRFNVPMDDFHALEIEVPCSTCGFVKKMVTWRGVEEGLGKRIAGSQRKGGVNRALKYK